MNKSILGEDLKAEKRKAFERHIATLTSRAGEIRSGADRAFLREITGSIRDAGGDFTPADEDVKRIALMESHLRGPGDSQALAEQLIPLARDITRGDALPSGRMRRLDGLLQIAGERQLSNGEVMDMHYLVILADQAEDPDGAPPEP